MDGTEQIFSKSKISQSAYLLFSDIEIKKKTSKSVKSFVFGAFGSAPRLRVTMVHLQQLHCVRYNPVEDPNFESFRGFSGIPKVGIDSQPKLPHWPKQLVVEVLVPNYPSGVVFFSCDSVEQNFDDKFHLGLFFSPWILRSWSLIIWNTCIKNPSLNRRRSACIQLCIDEIQEFLGAAENQQILDFHCSSSQKFHTQISSFEI